MKLFSELRNDLPASIVVFFVAVPLCLGIALASGASPISGLIAGIVGGIVVGIVSKSQLGVSGPAAGLAVIVAGAIPELGFKAFLLAVVLAGVIQIVLGLSRSGFIAYFFPSSVIKGMLAGIGVIIVLKQIPHAFGHDSDPEGDLKFDQVDGETTLSSLRAMIDDMEPSAILVSSVALGILILWETVLTKRSKVFRIIQGPLVAVGFGISFQLIASRFFPELALSSSHLVKVPIAGSLEELRTLIVTPDWSRVTDSAVYVTAAVLAVVASLETLLCVEATDKLDPQKRVTPTNRELIAQGCGNCVSGLIGGLPITQVIVRSSANIQSGGKTKLSAIMHGMFLLLFVALLPSVLNLIPLAVLASILFVVGYKLAKPALFKSMYESGMSQFLPFLVTILGIVFTDLLMGIGMGMVVAVMMILRRNYQNSLFMHMEEFDAPDKSHQVTMRLAEDVTFFNRGAMLKALSRIPDGSHVRIDVSDTKFIDPDVQEVIDDFKETCANRSITIEWIESQPNTTAMAS